MSDRVQSLTRAAAAPALRLSAVGSRILQRKCSCGGSGNECEECKKKQTALQRFPAGATGPTAVPSIVHQVLRSPGRPLDPSTRAFAEPRFGHDFGKVRIHTDDMAGKSAKAIHAAAYAMGHHVAFGTGQYMPETKAGRWLIAHELSHVVQQGMESGHDGGESNIKLELGPPTGRAEEEASRMADLFGGPPSGSSTALNATGPAIHRQPEEDWGKTTTPSFARLKGVPESAAYGAAISSLTKR